MKDHALIQSIIDSPDDDSPLMVYADWLEERGDSRADLIRAQCGLSTSPRFSLEYYDHLGRSNELLNRHATDWFEAPYPALSRYWLRRGMIDKITVTATRFLKQEALFSQHPIRELRLTRLKDKGHSVSECPLLRAIDGLDMDGLNVPTRDMQSLFCSPRLAQLRRLKLGRVNGVGFEEPPTAELLAHASFREHLECLSAYSTTFTSNELAILGRAGGLPKLDEFTFYVDSTDGAISDWASVLRSPIRRLTFGGYGVENTVRLGDVPIGPLQELTVNPYSDVPSSLVIELAERKAFETIERLQFPNRLHVPASKALFRNHHLGQCQRLDLRFEGQHSNTVVKHIAGHEPLTGLRELAIGKIHQGQLKTLCESDTLANLTCLRVILNEVDSASIQLLYSAKFGPNLQYLAVGGGSTGSPPRIELDRFPQLTTLRCEGIFGKQAWNWLAFTRPNDNLRSLTISYALPPFFESIYQKPRFPNLVELNVGSCTTTVSELEQVATSTSLPHLSRIRMPQYSIAGNPSRLKDQFGRQFQFRAHEDELTAIY